MKHRTLIAATGMSAALIMSTSASAVLTGVSVFAEAVGGPGPPPTGGPRTIWRIYANFSNTTDRVNAWGAGGDFSPGGIVNLNAAMTGPGTGFTNIGGAAGQLAPYAPGTDRDWDCYMTIGVLYGNQSPGGVDATTVMPGTPTFATGTQWIPDQTDGGGVFISPDDPQGRADYRISGNDTDHRVLLMQLVVNAGQNACGTIGIAWGTEGFPDSFVTPGLTICFPAAPGALPLLACAGLIGARRRR